MWLIRDFLSYLAIVHIVTERVFEIVEQMSQRRKQNSIESGITLFQEYLCRAVLNQELFQVFLIPELLVLPR